MASSHRWSGRLMTCFSFAASSMLSSAASSMSEFILGQTRRAMRQLPLKFADLHLPETRLWEQLDEEPKQAVIETLARLLSQAVQAPAPQEEAND
jgi:hypothetical protein